jgi:hypothetical protein
MFTREVSFGADGDKKEKLKKLGAIGATVGTAALGILAAKAQHAPNQMKQACGRRPLLKKNRAAYDACVAKQSGLGSGEASVERFSEPSQPEKQGMSKNTKTVLALGVVLLIGTLAYYASKKGLNA